MNKKIILFFLLILYVYPSNPPHPGPIKPRVPLIFKFNLQDSPITRYTPIIRIFNSTIHHTMETIIELANLQPLLFQAAKWYAQNRFIYKEFVQQVEAISNLTNIPFQKLFLFNLIYEISTFPQCTAVLLRQKDGTIIHGRNHDFYFETVIAPNLYTIQYYKNNVLIATSQSFAGSIWTSTGIRHGSFAINVNTRRRKYPTYIKSLFIDNAVPTLWLMRNVLLQQTSYTSAVNRLKGQKIGGSTYFIVSGLQPNEGIIIQRDTNKIHATYELNDDIWFLVQTNYDRDLPDPIQDFRKTPTEELLTKIGQQNLDKQVLFDDVMAQYPIFYENTIFTSVMVAKTGYIKTFGWYGTNPAISSSNLRQE